MKKYKSSIEEVNGPLIQTWRKEREDLLQNYFYTGWERRDFKKNLTAMGLSIRRVDVIVMPVKEKS